MPLLADYAITPDVFDVTSYSTEEVCGLHLTRLRELTRDDGLVRDLRGGEWRSLVREHARPWHRRAKEILKKLAKEGRLIECLPVGTAAPTYDPEWCAEAVAAHRRKAMLGGVIVTKSVKDAYPDERVVERIDRLPSAPWWTSRSPSVRLDRKLAAYREQMNLFLRHAKSLMFIDPHLDPGKPGYGDFASLLADAGHREPAPQIEIHRVCWTGNNRPRAPGRPAGKCRLDYAEAEKGFRTELATPLKRAGLNATVFFWDDFHDRYLISNLAGVSLPNGFDTTKTPGDVTTWTRLGPESRDDVQREFDEANRRHKCQHKFSLP